MMDAETTSKIRFLKKKDFHELNEYIELDQLQEKYGGNLKNLHTFWYELKIMKLL